MQTKKLNHNPLTIEVANRQDIPVDEQPLNQIVQKILADHDYCEGEVSIALVDDAEIRRLNNQYLQHDYETDVISFLLDCDEDRQYLNGQLIVSTETANRVAAEISNPFEQELLLYVIHGTLHLVGFDDHSDEQTEQMRAAEKKYLAVALHDSAPDAAPLPDGGQ